MKKNLFYSVFIFSMFALSAAVYSAPRHERYSTEAQSGMNRVSVTGRIDKITGQKALMIADGGERVTIHLGPQDYWRQKGYRMRAGVEVTVSGWGELYDDDGGYCYASEISGPDFFFDLCDSEGYPRWADHDQYYRGWRPTVYIYSDFYGCAPSYHWRGCPPPPRHHYSHRDHCRPQPRYRRGWR